MKDWWSEPEKAAYRAGARAAELGASLRNCPYPWVGTLRFFWGAGWLDSQQET